MTFSEHNFNSKSEFQIIFSNYLSLEKILSSLIIPYNINQQFKKKFSTQDLPLQPKPKKLYYVR